MIHSWYCQLLRSALSVGNILNFVYFAMIMKQVIQLILIMLVGTDDCVCVVFLWEETDVTPRGNRLSDRMTISHADARYRTLIEAVR